MKNIAYSVNVYLALVVIFVPAIWAWLLGGTVDSWPAWMCLLGGGAVSGMIAAWRHRRRGSKRKLAVDSSPDSIEQEIGTSLIRYLGPPCWAVALGLLGNRYLDNSKPVRHVVELREVRKQKHGDIIELESWRSGERTVTFRRGRPYDGGVHRGLPKGTPIAVTTRTGAFGWEWLERMVPVRRQAPVRNGEAGELVP